MKGYFIVIAAFSLGYWEVPATKHLPILWQFGAYVFIGVALSVIAEITNRRLA